MCPGSWETGEQLDPVTGTPRGIFLAVSLIGPPTVHINFANSLNAMIIETAKAGIPVQVHLAKTYSVAHSRNTLVHRFLKQTNFSHLAFVDADVCPTDPRWLVRLISHGLPFTGGVIWNKSKRNPDGTGGNMPAAWVHDWTKPDEPYAWQTIMLENPEGLYEVDWSAAGMLLIRRDVFLAMKPPWFVYSHEAEYDEKGDPISGFSEDAVFCFSAKKAGFPLVLDLGLRAKHIGMAEVGPDSPVLDWT